MRFIFRTAALFAATVSLCSAAQAEPLISAFIGTPTPTSKLAYFVLDFNDPGPNPETYAFGWHYEGTKTGDDYVQALAAELTGADGFVATLGSGYYQGFGYNGRYHFNHFDPVFGQGSNTGEPNAFWNLWLGFDGATWVNSNFGVSSITLATAPPDPLVPDNQLQTASWIGFRWNPDNAGAPRTPQQVVAVVPEAGTFALLGTGLAIGTVLVRRRQGRR